MKLTVEYVQQRFEEFNARMFGGRLPVVPIEIADAAGYLGKCVSIQRRLPSGVTVHSDFRLRFNARINLPENVVEDTIIHEMIHLLILWTGLQDSSSHGQIFKAIMQSINAAHWRNISISHRSSKEEAEQAVSTRRTWHVIAAVYFKSGRIGVKVLPRTAQKILDYYRVVSSHKEIDQVRLFFHDNPFFNRYPTSAVYRFHEIDREVLETNLTGAHRLKVSGNQLLEDKTP